MKKASAVWLTLLLLPHFLIARPQELSDNGNEWTDSADQKVWGLMTIWAQTKFAFPHRERLKAINWDSTVQAFIPRVMNAHDQESYYKSLMELITFLRDSHTECHPALGTIHPGI